MEASEHIENAKTYLFWAWVAGPCLDPSDEKEMEAWEDLPDLLKEAGKAVEKWEVEIRNLCDEKGWCSFIFTY